MKITVTNRAAAFSDGRDYRWWLSRTWTAEGYPNLKTLEPVLWICLNPSTADQFVDDATVRSIMRISTTWGYGKFYLCNVFGWRATDPRELALAGSGIRNNENLSQLYDRRQRCGIVVAAWGESHFVTAEDEHRIFQLVGGVMYCPGTNKSGSPKHPLYLPTNTPCVAWGPRR